MQRSVRRITALMSSFCAATLVSLACGQNYSETAFLCDPSKDDACPDSHVCCSTDAAALDVASLPTQVLPDYAGGAGTPLFSGVNNERSRYGRCVDLGRVDGVETIAEGAADGCPRPCNPTWLGDDITTVCGADTFCCPTEELGEMDCAFDPGIGVSGCWRPVTGNDIETFGGLEVTTWASSAHDTHQDPRGLGCQDFAEAAESSASFDELVRACYQRLGVANQRGLCTPSGGEADIAAVCPLADPAYRDACEQLNDAEGLVGCEVVDFP